MIYGLLPIYGSWFFSNLIVFRNIENNPENPGNGFFSSHSYTDIAAGTVILGIGVMLGIASILCIYMLDVKRSMAKDDRKIFGHCRNLLNPLFLGFFLLLLSFHIKISILERIQVSGESMEPALKSGQVLWIQKLTTGFQLPGLDFPIPGLFVTGKIPWNGLGLPERGSIVVFHYPGTGAQYYIKRVIALPGEAFHFKNGRVYINGKVLKEGYIGPGIITESNPDIYQPPPSYFPRELDFLSYEVKYSAMNGCGSRGVVPPHTLLVLGDNRPFSRDSRSIGFIPIFFIRGIALGH